MWSYAFCPSLVNYEELWKVDCKEIIEQLKNMHFPPMPYNTVYFNYGQRLRSRFRKIIIHILFLLLRNVTFKLFRKMSERNKLWFLICSLAEASDQLLLQYFFLFLMPGNVCVALHINAVFSKRETLYKYTVYIYVFTLGLPSNDVSCNPFTWQTHSCFHPFHQKNDFCSFWSWPACLCLHIPFPTDF